MTVVLAVLCQLAGAWPGAAQEVTADASRDPAGGSPPATAAPPPVDALQRQERLNGVVVTRVFAESIGDNLGSVVPIETENGRLVALSVVVASNGYLLSKASELEARRSETLLAKIPDHPRLPVRMVQLQKENDLALLKVEAELHPVEWAASTELKSGFLVSAVSNARGAVRVGIVSAAPRPIEREGGIIGVGLSPRGRGGNRGVLVTRVFDGSGASAAGIESGDVILHVAGKQVHSAEDVTGIVATFDVGESVEIIFERRVDGGTRRRAVDVGLGYRREVLGGTNRNEVLSGAASNRRAGFENVVQHDIPLGPEAMGGPLFTIDGRVVGINIARRDRVTTYALASEVAQRVARDMIAVDMRAAAARTPDERQR